jgi:D-arabinose 1-dehydrogenase-like Zn-dependent alcohol dehydrogenase
VTQLARALGAKHAISSTTNHAKAEQAKALGFNEVIDNSLEKLGDGLRRITDGYGADIVQSGFFPDSRLARNPSNVKPTSGGASHLMLRLSVVDPLRR